MTRSCPHHFEEEAKNDPCTCGITIVELLPSYTIKHAPATDDGESIIRVVKVIWPGETVSSMAYTCGGCGRAYCRMEGRLLSSQNALEKHGEREPVIRGIKRAIRDPAWNFVRSPEHALMGQCVAPNAQPGSRFRTLYTCEDDACGNQCKYRIKPTTVRRDVLAHLSLPVEKRRRGQSKSGKNGGDDDDDDHVPTSGGNGKSKSKKHHHRSSHGGGRHRDGDASSSKAVSSSSSSSTNNTASLSSSSLSSSSGAHHVSSSSTFSYGNGLTMGGTSDYTGDYRAGLPLGDVLDFPPVLPLQPHVEARLAEFEPATTSLQRCMMYTALNNTTMDEETLWKLHHLHAELSSLQTSLESLHHHRRQMVFASDVVAGAMIHGCSSTDDGGGIMTHRLLSMGPALSLRRSVLKYRLLDVHDAQWELQQSLPSADALPSILSRLGITVGGLLLPACGWPTEMITPEHEVPRIMSNPLMAAGHIIGILMGLSDPPAGFGGMPSSSAASGMMPMSSPSPSPSPSPPLSSSPSPPLSSSPSPSDYDTTSSYPTPSPPSASSSSSLDQESSRSALLAASLAASTPFYRPAGYETSSPTMDTPLYHSDGRSIMPGDTISPTASPPPSLSSSLPSSASIASSIASSMASSIASSFSSAYPSAFASSSYPTGAPLAAYPSMPVSSSSFMHPSPVAPTKRRRDTNDESLPATPVKEKNRGRFRKPTSDDDDFDNDEDEYEYGGGLTGRAKRRRRRRGNVDRDLNQGNDEDDDWAGAADDKPKPTRRGGARARPDYAIGALEDAPPSRRKSAASGGSAAAERRAPIPANEASQALDIWLATHLRDDVSQRRWWGTVGIAMRQKREELGWSQAFLATDICAAGALSRIELGTRKPSTNSLGPILKKLGLTPEDILAQAGLPAITAVAAVAAVAAPVAATSANGDAMSAPSSNGASFVPAGTTMKSEQSIPSSSITSVPSAALTSSSSAAALASMASAEALVAALLSSSSSQALKQEATPALPPLSS